MHKTEITYKIVQEWIRLIRGHVKDLGAMEDKLILLLDWHRANEVLYLSGGQISDGLTGDEPHDKVPVWKSQGRS